MDNLTRDAFTRGVANHTEPWAPLLSDAALDLFSFVMFMIISCPSCCLGIVTNIANIVVYTKMGFSESSNVNFLALSVFDFLASVTILAMRTLYIPYFKGLANAALARYISHCLSHAIYVVIGGSAMMTALIAVERCICVVFPIKVKTWLTRRRSLYLMLTVVAYHLAFLVLIYSDPGPPYDAHPKKIAFYYVALYSIPSTTCFFVVVVSTIFLVVHLRRNQRWRKQTSSRSVKTSDKEERLVKTIIAISIIFIICSFGNVSIFIASILYPPFQYSNPYFANLVLAFFGVSLNFQTVSACLNFFFYYRMSSRFKRVFHTRFAPCRTGKSDASISGTKD
ncbi:hypothetical protein EGW08_006503 [Elysia chlorotica]|uniref:G-protein coupled receptors family 1 profile domain-containing protein n=1 Tax=Elysia chlorotica TaxID=188477 RepID=A0A433TVY7_ELYCH|nr:hypothetical protein EGW08_006503 [Elysia chlorotica]